jgi:hypothetical protein
VTDHADQLREAFTTHEHEVPDPGAVYDRVQKLSRRYRRRRRGVQAAGGAVLSAGLVAGVINLPAMLPGGTQDSVIVAPAAAPSASAASPSKPGPDQLQAQWDAFFGAGYTYDDAARLAEIWKMAPTDVKAEAGRRLLAGETLPIQPDPEAALADKAVEKFLAAGYVYEDAVKLAKLWKIKEVGDAKVAAGKKLLNGEKLPIKPDPGNVVDAKEAEAVEAFFYSGYTYEDAQRLAELWKLTTAYDAKVAGGRKLLAGETLPIKPS